MKYNTKQREAILRFLKENRGAHVSVDALVEALKGRRISVGKTTVYRYLEQLCQQGLALKYAPQPGMGTCYSYLPDESCQVHYHLKCTQCGRLFHLECPELDALVSHVSKDHGFALDHTRTVLYGCCSNCLQGDENT